MQAGLLVIAPDVGGIGEVVNERTLILVSGEQRVEEYVEAIEAALGDPARFYQRIETRARYVAEHHTWNGLVAALQQTPGYLGEDGTSPTSNETDLNHG